MNGYGQMEPPNARQPDRAGWPLAPNHGTLLSLHIAEYEALMTAITYYIALHVDSWGVVVAVLGAAVQQWSQTHQPITVWVAFAAVQGLLHIWVTLMKNSI